MRRSWFMQMLWKEYREQRAFWLATALIVVVTQAISRYLYSLEPRAALGGWEAGFWLALGAPAFYAAGAGATLFATDHERGTFMFLRAMRCRPGQLAIPKFVWAVLSVVGMQAALWLAAGALNLFEFPPASHVWESFKFWELAALLALAWGAAFSMLLREPLRAVALALLAATVTVYTAPFLAAEIGLQSGSDKDSELLRGLPVQCFWLALVAAFDCWLARRWAVEAVPRSIGFRRREKRMKRDRPNRSRRGIEFTLDFLRQMGALCWQAWRGAAGWAWLLGGLVVAILIAEIWSPEGFASASDSRRFSPAAARLILLQTLAIAVAALCGALAFRADQQREGRQFLAARGVSARYLWLSRQVVWSVIACVCAVTVFILPTTSLLLASWKLLESDPPLFNGTFSRIPGTNTPWWWVARNDAVYFALFGTEGLITLLACIPLAYAAGQWLSMCVRSSLIAVLFAIFLAAVLSAWTMLMAALEISLRWSVLPIFVVLLAASWLRAPFWLVDRRRLTAFVASTAPVLLVVLALVVAVPVYRVAEIPSTTFDWATPNVSAEQKVASEEKFRLYRIAGRMVAEPWNGYSMSRQAGQMRRVGEEPASDDGFQPPTPEQVAVVNANACRQAINLALEQSLRDDISPSDFENDRLADAETKNELAPLPALLQLAAEVQTAEGKLEDAWKSYLGAFRLAQQTSDGMPREALRALPYWASKDDQTSEDIRRAISELWQFQPLAISQAKATLRREYQRQLTIIDDLPTILAEIPPASRELRSDVALLEQRLPWERIRARRLLDWVTKSDLDLIENVERGLASDDVRHLFHEHFFKSDRILVRGTSVSPLRQDFERWSRTTPLFVGGGPDGPDICWLVATADSQFRATIILLALEAWKRDHGVLPDRLEQLVGDYFPRLPLDPLTGGPFVYYPAGVPIALQLRKAGGWFPRLPAGTPFLWSVAGPGRLIPAVRDERHYFDGRQDLTPYRFTSSDLRAVGENLSLDAALKFGCLYVIP